MKVTFAAALMLAACSVSFALGCGESENPTVIVPDSSVEMTEEEMEAYNNAAAAGSEEEEN